MHPEIIAHLITANDDKYSYLIIPKNLPPKIQATDLLCVTLTTPISENAELQQRLSDYYTRMNYTYPPVVMPYGSYKPELTELISILNNLSENL